MTSAPRPDTAAAHRAERRMALAREWDRLVEQARGLDGFEDFLAPRLRTLLPAAQAGPVVILNTSRWRCDALVVTTGGVHVEPLPRLSQQSIVDRTLTYLEALQEVDLAVHDLRAARLEHGPGEATAAAARRRSQAMLSLHRALDKRETTLVSLLRWLWDTVAEPVLAVLGFVEPPDGDTAEWPRLWWCPTGLLTLLPLHGAGHHDGSLRTVLDRVVSSYTPTLRALVEARRPLHARPDDERLLIVSLPDDPAQVPLTDVAREREMLTSLFPSRHTLLEGGDATADLVRSELPRHRWVHFSCHGGQDLLDPSRGGLSLHGGDVLRVADIGVQRHRGEFAFLSACQTATGVATLPDETITLAAALHYTGYRQVVGTLWSVYDDIAADVAEAVYRDLTSTGRFEPARSARALHTAVRALRDDRRLAPGVWTPFTHTGP
ncbi:CHAT domain-containing protein [Streptomyces sp. NPDC003247]|uniref:CHAT domain-containing protein n=1 Tax=Streptomyces sp. NPDC003247 TaxID=3364677 RepID=UPI0036BACEAC